MLHDNTNEPSETIQTHEALLHLFLLFFSRERAKAGNSAVLTLSGSEAVEITWRILSSQILRCETQRVCLSCSGSVGILSFQQGLAEQQGKGRETCM
jgi:hypothetical protein